MAFFTRSAVLRILSLQRRSAESRGNPAPEGRDIFCFFLNRRYSLFLSLAVFCALLISNNGVVFAYQHVKVEGRDLVVDFDENGVYVPYLIKGVGYSSSPVGRFPSDWGYTNPNDPRPDNTLDDPAILARDFSLIQAMNTNTIRIWAGNNAQVTEQDFNNPATPWFQCGCDQGSCGSCISSNRMYLTDRTFTEAENHNLKIIAGFGLPWPGQWQCNGGTATFTQWTDYTNQSVRLYYLNKFSAYVNQFKDYPALLFWALGNENNLGFGSDPAQIQAYYSLLNDLAEMAHAIEGADAHPVAIVNGEIGNINNAGQGTRDQDLPDIDIWGANVYRGQSFGNLFNDFAARSAKPFWISEYGIDAWHSNDVNNPQNGFEDQATQANWDGNLWDEIASRQDVAIGATVMAYADEWWKPYQWECLQFNGSGTCIQFTFNAHNAQFGFGPADISCPADGVIDTLPPSPDNFFNEEYWGIMSIAPNPVAFGPDVMTPRAVYSVLQTKFAPVITPPVVTFTNDPLVPGVTPIKAAHVNELRTGVNDIRGQVGLPAAVWTNASLTGAAIRAVHVQELRDRLNEAFNAVGLDQHTFTNPFLFGVAIKAVHIQELRELLKSPQ